VARNEAKAASWCRKAAKPDHARAQVKLAALYEEGRGLPQDHEKALKWTRRAAALGWLEAQERLDAPAPEATVPQPAVAPETGETTTVEPRPVAPPAPLPQRPADEHDADAQYRLGLMYGAGDGVERDAAKAEEWLVAAARQGHRMATYRLGFLYLRGEGASGRSDMVGAYAWFSIAAREGIGDAAEWRDKTARKLTRAELSTADELIRTLRPSE
jgi:TPR repeat protein